MIFMIVIVYWMKRIMNYKKNMNIMNMKVMKKVLLNEHDNENKNKKLAILIEKRREISSIFIKTFRQTC